MRSLFIAALLLYSTFSKAADTAMISPPDTSNPIISCYFLDCTPTFPGGEDSLMRFIRANLEYPEIEAEDSCPISGRVVVGFVIDSNGIIGDIKIVKSLGKNFDRAVIRVVSMMPRFETCKLQGRRVPTRYVIPIQFGVRTE